MCRESADLEIPGPGGQSINRSEEHWRSSTSSSGVLIRALAFLVRVPALLVQVVRLFALFYCEHLAFLVRTAIGARVVLLI